jgi:hypothetical protein
LIQLRKKSFLSHGSLAVSLVLSERTLDLAKAYFWRFLRESGRWAKAVFDWLQDGQHVREAHGLQLMREWLSPEQLAQYDAYGYFDVIGSDSGKRYRVQLGTGMNILELDDAGDFLLGWCFVPEGCLVAGDVVLAQKIALETNESGALAVAKTFRRPSGPA